ncbi:MAG TPA: radical SAM protein [Caldilineaceae bacterium]|nr:radical SAM protein [Caldilineaceae bacterium]
MSIETMYQSTLDHDARNSFENLVPSEFNVFVDSWLGEQVLAYNTLTGALMVLPNARHRAVSEILGAARVGLDIPAGLHPLAASLRRDGFLVPRGFDERAEVHRRYHEGRRTTRGLLITVAPTVACNFRCTYCFQEHPNRKMDDEDARRVRAYVNDRLEPDTSLGITWFGGEPLIGFEFIRELAPWFETIAAERRCRVRQNIITNGLLLDDEKADFLAGLRSFDHAQITIDGPAPVHDHRRPTLGGQSTFERVLARVVAASGRIRFNIRVNVDRTNCGELEALVTALEEAGLRNRGYPYLGHTTAYTDVCAGVADTTLTREEFAQVDVAFRLHLLLRGWRGVAPLPKPQGGPICVTDHPNGIVLSPGGLAFRCWNDTALPPEQSFIRLTELGRLVTSPGGDGWGEWNPFTHKPCRTCRAQPLCRGGCPSEARKNTEAEPGNCVTSRFVLADQLRLHHLEQALNRGVEVYADEACQ